VNYKYGKYYLFFNKLIGGQKMERLKIAVTGAGGFLNSRLINYFKLNHPLCEMIPLKRQDICLNAQKTAQVIKQIQPDIIIHGAAMTATADCENDPELAYTVNVTNSLNLAKAANEVKAKLVFFSSEQVFNGNPEEGPYTEEGKAIPNTVYGRTKLEAENLLKNELENLWILRFSWLCGFPERNLPVGANLLWNVLKTTLKGKSDKMPVHELRGITYVYDIIDHFSKVFELPYGTYHFGSQNNESTYETAIFILKCLGLEEERIQQIILPDHDKYRERNRDLRLSYTKIQNAGIPIVTSQESIERAVSEFRFRVL